MNLVLVNYLSLGYSSLKSRDIRGIHSHSIPLFLLSCLSLPCSTMYPVLVNYLSLGYSSLKSRDIRGVHSRKANILAAISLPCHFPLQVSPLGLKKKFKIFHKIPGIFSEKPIDVHGPNKYVFFYSSFSLQGYILFKILYSGGCGKK